MNRWLHSALILVGLVTAAPAAEPPRKPNVLFLFADDMRADSIAALGNPVAKTPNLDALVSRGFALTNAYCFGGNSAAVCTPGIPKGPKGLPAPGDGLNFPVAMRDAGYLTYHHGKRGNTALSFRPSLKSTSI